MKLCHPIPYGHVLHDMATCPTCHLDGLPSRSNRMPSPIKMLIFSSASCPTCKHLENNVLPTFVKSHPDLVIEKHMIAVNDGDVTTPGAEELADAYDVQAAPTIIVIGEVARGMGEVCSAPALKKFVQDAQKKGRTK